MNTAVAVIALVASLNPARRWVELGRRPPTVLAVGAVVALAVYATAAAVTGPLLDGLDISSPNIRIGGAAVVGLRAVADLGVTPRAEAGGASGWRAALVPVAFPVLARPDVAVLAMAVSTELGVATVIVGAGVGLVVAVAGVPALGERRAAGWLGPVFTVVTIVAAVDLLVDAVLDV